MVVKVCDMIAGAGKTSSAITQMNEDTDSRYIFITPFLEEAERIKASCPAREFAAPENARHNKLEDLHELLANKRNIVSTHALFKSYNAVTKSLIQAGGYKLIMDEVSEVVTQIEISKADIDMLRSGHFISVDSTNGRVSWEAEGYKGRFQYVMDAVKTGNVELYRHRTLLWTYPVEIFSAFQDVVILTYLFDAQKQKYYFDLHGVETTKIGVTRENGVYRFCDYPCELADLSELSNKIHILEDKKLNAVGDKPSALSTSWYKSKKASRSCDLVKLKNNITNVFINRFHSRSEENLWTTFNAYQKCLQEKGYIKGFLACNARSTNKYCSRDHLAYCVNCYLNPVEKNYFLAHGIDVDEDQYALSEMIQWVWRSAIRNGREIWLYVPSRRMRELFQGWLKSLQNREMKGVVESVS